MPASTNLVMDGESFAFPAFAAASFDGDRIPLPARLIDQLALRGDASIECLLVVMSVGRYRLVLNARPNETVRDTGLSKLLNKWKAVGSADEFLDAELRNEQAAIRARVIPTTISRMGSGWRITIPKEAKLLVQADQDSSFVFVLLVGGFVEFWFPETLRQAVSVPLGNVLR